jgi:hypothetical protein
MSNNIFLEQENLQMLWEVLIDEPLIKQLCNSEVKLNELVRIFESNVSEFFMVERNNCNNLIELNKKYILLIINYVMKITNTPNNSNANNIQNQIPPNQYKKIKIHPEEPRKQPITFEDIQNDRMTLFEKELNKKQDEFTNAMTLPVPPVPKFNDTLDEPMSEIELEIKRIQEQRNYDIEIINNTNKNSNITANENWLKPQETSIKNEKLIKINTINNLSTVNANSSPKHISWEDEVEENEAVNIFGKLKKIKTNTNNFENNNDDEHVNTGNNFQLQIDEIKKDISILNEKLDLILQKL